MQRKEDYVKNGVTGVGLDDLIEAALTDKKYNHQRLGNEIQRYAGRVSAARAPDLPRDLHEDVAQETILILWRWGGDALAKRKPRELLRAAVLEAIRVVRTSYTPPGRPTQPSGKKEPARVAPETVEQVMGLEDIRRATVDDGIGPSIDFDLVPSPTAIAAIAQVESRMDVERLLAAAPSFVATALHAIHFEDATMEQMATKMQMSRFALNRHLNAFYATARLAA